MNLMHQDIRVTDSIYAPLAGDEVQQRIARLASGNSTQPSDNSDLAAFIYGLSDAELSQALIVIAERLAK